MKLRVRKKGRVKQFQNQSSSLGLVVISGMALCEKQGSRLVPRTVLNGSNPFMPLLKIKKIMQHNEATIKIYFTREYGAFKSILGNRDLSQTKINRIIRDIDNGLDMLKFCPIIVDKDMNVIDGQHRLFVAKKIKSNIWYVIADKLDLIDIAKINSNTEKWKAKDFLNCYIVQGLKDYEVLEDFVTRHKISVGIGIKLLMSGCITSSRDVTVRVKPAFERGLFKVEHMEYAERLLSVAERFSTFDKHLTRDFLNAIHNLLNAGKANIDDLIRNFNHDSSALDRCGTTKDYMNALEVIYNWKKKERHLIF